MTKFSLVQELESVEENYRKEIDDLWSMVKNLQLENKHLSSVTGDAASTPTSSTCTSSGLWKGIQFGNSP